MSSGFDDPFAPDEAQRRREARERAIELLYEAQLKGVGVAEIIAAELIPPAPSPYPSQESSFTGLSPRVRTRIGDPGIDW